MRVRAVVADPGQPSGVRVGEVEEPVPGRGQVLVEAQHGSLNRADLDQPAGAVLGRDVAGVVRKTTAGGPPVGTRVVGLARGAFAQRVAVDVDALAEVPEGVSLADAVTLPLAGVAAVQAFRAGMLETPTKGARVLVTGASGGVGRFAVQVASYGGAYVIAIAGNPDRIEELTELGADEAVADLAGVDEPVDLVLDTVGGAELVAAWQLLAPDGNVQCIGSASGQPSAFPPGTLTGSARTLHAFQLATPVGEDLTALVRLVEAGTLRVPIAWRGPLDRVGEAADALRSRKLGGKAVLDLATVARSRS
jgi:NADPH:quinone reductase-like Zn-dependent oxidoreductase